MTRCVLEHRPKFAYIHHMQVDDIISYAQLVAEERVNLQKGMNFGIGRNYSVFLMSVRKRSARGRQEYPEGELVQIILNPISIRYSKVGL